ncbi:MAG: helix-turn-helix domain-containing protein [Chloroflexi bacterium]|nr:helix-turn-helix domain-containing protein [Chloroflexota bacterium]
MAVKNPTAQQALTGAQPHRLLSAEENAICDQVAAGHSLDSQRARALLAIDGGATQVEASRQAGLTPGQMQYCLRKFRQQGLAIFPDAAPEPVSEPDPTPPSEPEPVASDGGAETMVEKPRNKAGDKTGKGKKATRKKKKSGKKKNGKKGRKSRSAKSSRKKDRKPKSGKAPRKKEKSKSDKRGNKKRKKKSKR